MPYASRTDMCATCAFREGTEANQTWHTKQMAYLCLLAEEPFYCHENILGCVHGGEAHYIPVDGKMHVCAGWVARMKEQPPQPEWRKEVATALMQALQDAIDAAPLKYPEGTVLPPQEATNGD